MREFLIVLFAVSGQFSVLFDTGSLDLTLVIGCVFGLEVIFSLLSSKILLPPGGREVIVSLAVLIIWICISSLLGESSSYVWTKWLSFGAVLIGFAYCLVKGQQISFSRIVFWHCLYCLILAGFYYQELIEAGNLQGLLWNSNSLGLSDYLTSSDYMYMCLLMLYSDRRYKILLIVFVVFAPVLAFLGARGATIFFCLVFLAAIFREKVRGRHLIVTLAVLTVGQAASTSSMLRYRFESALSGQDKSLGQRQIYFLDACDSIISRPLCGVGFGSFGEALYDKDMRMYPHNLILEVLVELGMIGFGLFAYFLSVSWRFFARSNLNWLLLFLLMDLMKSYTFVDLKYLWVFLGLALATAPRSGRGTIEFKQ